MAKSTELDYLEELKQLESELVRNDKDLCSIDELAKIVARSVFTIYKASSPTEDGIFGLEWLVLFMNRKNNYDILEFICRHTDHLPPVKVPRLRAKKNDEQCIYKELQGILNNASMTYYDFMNNPQSTDKLKQLKQTIRKAIKELLSVEKHSEKLNIAQLEMEL
ncbi:MAG: hypothetical protein HND52_03660 [Ignavibacteriae bacterium]|nr:hypothetical protein [Ignavibacteriota bacterium]NOG97052.1 hypothetical protein [Ignavibacteriota bacterium]